MLLAENYNKNPIQVLENEDFAKSQQDITQRAKYLTHPYKGSVAEIKYVTSKCGQRQTKIFSTLHWPKSKNSFRFEYRKLLDTKIQTIGRQGGSLPWPGWGATS
jgi:hypothetical protein